MGMDLIYILEREGGRETYTVEREGGREGGRETRPIQWKLLSRQCGREGGREGERPIQWKGREGGRERDPAYTVETLIQTVWEGGREGERPIQWKLLSRQCGSKGCKIFVKSILANKYQTSKMLHIVLSFYL